jgi:hypothetical protein
VVSKLSTKSLLQKKVDSASAVIRLTLDPARVAAKIFQGYNQFLGDKEKVVFSVSHQLVSKVATNSMLSQKVLRAPRPTMIGLSRNQFFGDKEKVAGTGSA